VALALIGVIFSTPILELMGSPEDVINLASLYLRIYFLAMPATLIYNFGAAILRASGDTKTPLYFLSTAGVINVLLNLLLVIKFNLDVAGVGIATVVSQYISAALILIHFARLSGDLHFSFRKLGIDKGILVKIIQIGIPAGIQGTVFSLSNVVIQSAINSFGSTIVAANSAASNIEGFVYIAMNSVYQTAITFVGQNYGAGKYKRVIRVLLECLGIVFVVGVVLGNTVHFFGEQLLHIYSSNPEVISAGMVRVKYICTIYFLCGMMDTMVGALRGIGKSVLPMVVSLTGACALRLVWIATVFQLHKTPEMLYIAYPITWIITLGAHVICFIIAYRHILKTHRVAE
jgi:putative MATE family efflux protein